MRIGRAGRMEVSPVNERSTETSERCRRAVPASRSAPAATRAPARLLLIPCALLVLGPGCDPHPPRGAAEGDPGIRGAAVAYYDIVGSTASELRRQMDLLGPSDAGLRVDAYTAWYIRWNWPGHGTPDGDPSRATTSIQITVTLPRWANPAGADPALLKRWDEYRQALARHEQGHVEIVTRGYSEVLRAIRDANGATAEQAAQQALARIREAERVYDEETRHGATQGATFAAPLPESQRSEGP